MDEHEQKRTPGRYGLDEIEGSHLEIWPNAHPERDYVVHMEIPEFTCLCPRSGFPDFATITIDYVPDQHVVELKSLKLYINAFRSVKVFHEHVINMILEDFVSACDPLSVEIEGDFNVRGNIKTTIRASYRKAEVRSQKSGVSSV